MQIQGITIPPNRPIPTAIPSPVARIFVGYTSAENWYLMNHYINIGLRKDEHH